MPTNDRDEHRTVQDDRAALGIDAEDESPLVKGEGAPLAEDGAIGSEAPPAAAIPVLLGGAPVPVSLEVDGPDRTPASHAMTAPDDRPIGD